MLTIDIGNSRIKWALFQGNEIIDHGAVVYQNNKFEAALSNADLPVASNKLLISHVAGEELKDRLSNWLKKNDCNDFDFAQTRSAQCNIVNSYTVPASLGVDRWLALIAAFNIGGRGQAEAVCVVDCGTAITLDVLGANGHHIGGLIMPGYQTMYQSLISNTGNIQNPQKTEQSVSVKPRLACSTHEAVEQGCAQLIVHGLSAIIHSQQKRINEKMHCIVTGGDGQWVSENLASDNFEVENSYNPFLVQQGLYLTTQEKSS